MFKCRVCHDEAKDHQLDRKAITTIVCRHCKKEQPVSEKCVKCNTQFGEYSCLECCLFDDDTSKEQYHCQGCGICRVGGKENFNHCNTCGYCINKSIQGSHKCIPNVSKSGCPVCMDDLHSSREGITVPSCGHLIHTKCLKGMTDRGLYRCPVCNVSLADMEQQWRHLDQEVKAWPMPRRYRHFRVKILCNDCHKETEVKYHIIGMKCMDCASYNTRRIGDEEPPSDTDSDLTSDEEESDDPANVTPFERHISTLLRTLSSRVRALERQSSDEDFELEEEEEEEEEDEDDLSVIEEEFPEGRNDEDFGLYFNPYLDTSPHDADVDEDDYVEDIDEDDDEDMEENVEESILSLNPTVESVEDLYQEINDFEDEDQGCVLM